MISSFRLLLLLFFPVFIHGQSQNPCHSNTHRPPATGCSEITLPDGFCGGCQFGFITSAGFYANCRKTFQIEDDDAMCMDAYQQYVDDNPCDTPRVTALADFKASNGTDGNARKILDFFYYAVCEQGCDCMPLNNVNRNKPVVDVFRGNCPVHAFFDICRVLPNIELIKLEGTATPNTTLPAICPLVTSWWNSPAASNWFADPAVVISNDIAYFLERVTEATQLTTNLKFYHKCFDLENAQSRISALPPIDYVPPLWYDRIEDEDTTGLLKRCFKKTRAFIVPMEGDRCARRPKLCYFGTQDCIGVGAHPEIRCFCDGEIGDREWDDCPDEPCPF